MTTWPAGADLGDLPTLTAGFRPFRSEFPVLRDPALNDQPPVVAFKDCGCGVLKGEQCDCAELLAQFETHLARPIRFRQQGRAA